MPATAAQSRKPTARTKASSTKGASSSRSRPSSRLSARKANAFPGWKDLDGGRTKKTSSKRKASTKASAARRRRLDAVPSLKTGLLVFLGFVAVVLFVSHVYGTQATLDALQDARRDNERLRLTHQRLQGDVDRMTSPEAVMPRAAALGLEESVAYGPTIVVADE